MRKLYYRTMSALWNSGLPLPGADRGDSVSIVCAHGVHTAEMEAIAPPPTSSVPVESFRSNVEGLARHYTVISLTDAVAMLTGRAPFKRKCVVLTFDDSLLCTANVAFPVLKEMGIPATVFVSTDAVETGEPYWWLRVDYAWHTSPRETTTIQLPGNQTVEVQRGNPDSIRRVKKVLRELPATERESFLRSIHLQFDSRIESPKQYPYAANMTWEDVSNVIRSGFEVGSHTVSHANLKQIPAADAAHEIKASREIIEKRTGAACRTFCYPYGSFTEAVSTAVRQAGFEAATTTIGPGRNRSGDDLFTLRRFQFPAHPQKLPFLLSGAAR